MQSIIGIPHSRLKRLCSFLGEPLAGCLLKARERSRPEPGIANEL